MMNVADMLLEELDKSMPPDIANPVAALRGRAAQLLTTMTPRTTISDGSRGYYAKAETVIEVVAGDDPQNPDAPRERILLKSTESEIKVHDPVLTLEGALRIDLEIMSYVVEGTSSVLFPGEPVALVVGRKADPTLPPTYGSIDIPLGVDFGRVPLLSTQMVYLAAETPIGTLKNPEPARMVAYIDRIPPVGIAYHQQGVVPLVTPGGEVAATKDMTETRLTELIV